MKKKKYIIAMVTCISIFFSMVTSTYAFENICSNDIGILKGNVVTTYQKKRVEFVGMFIDCYFYVNRDDITLEIYDVFLDMYVPQGGATYYTPKVSISNKKKITKYIMEVTMKADFYIGNRLEETQYMKIYFE